MALARLKMLPLSKSAPLAICAFMILSVSSNKMGIKRSAMDIIMATSCTGTLNIFKGPIIFSIPSVRLFGVVVSVITDDPMISSVRRIAMEMAIFRPSCVMVSFQIVKSGVPCVRNRLNTTVIIISMTIVFIPFTMNLNGTFDSRITIPRNRAAITYPA